MPSLAQFADNTFLESFPAMTLAWALCGTFELSKIEKGKVQHKTHARIVVESDPRNVLVMHAFAVAFFTHLKPAMTVLQPEMFSLFCFFPKVGSMRQVVVVKAHEKKEKKKKKIERYRKI